MRDDCDGVLESERVSSWPTRRCFLQKNYYIRIRTYKTISGYQVLFILIKSQINNLFLANIPHVRYIIDEIMYIDWGV